MATSKKSAAKKAVKKAVKRAVRPIPKGYQTVTATMNQSDASATIAFCKKAFGAKVGTTMKAPGGKFMHAELLIGDSIVMISDAMMEPARQASLFLYVPNVDKTMAKAVKAGATVMKPAENEFWGDRFGRVTDPQGNLWAIATHIENVKPAELKTRMKAALKQMAAANK